MLDPSAAPLHNGELLAHALAVVSSPTSFLAEFAVMGGVPFLLSFNETHFYHGRKLHDLYTSFCHVITDAAQLGQALRRLLANPNTIEPYLEDRLSAVSRLFGPSDGHSADRLTAALR